MQVGGGEFSNKIFSLRWLSGSASSHAYAFYRILFWDSMRQSSCWLLKRIASVFTSKRGDCVCWACWLDCHNLSALSCNLASVAGHGLESSLSVRSTLIVRGKKWNMCVDHVFAQYTPVLTRLEDYLHKSKIFGNLLHLRLLSSNIAMYALGNKNVCLWIIDFISSFTLGKTYSLFSARHYVVAMLAQECLRCTTSHGVLPTLSKFPRPSKKSPCVRLSASTSDRPLLSTASGKVALSPRPSR